MTLYTGGPLLVNSFMDEADIIPPPAPVPPPPPTINQRTEDDELMLIGSIGFKLVFAGAATITTQVPRTTDASNNNPTRSRFEVLQLDAELSAAGVVEAYWDSEITKKIYVISTRRQLIQVPNGATAISVISPGAGNVTLTFGRAGA